MTTSLARQREGDAPPLLLLHPLGADHRFFAPLSDHLDRAAWTADVTASADAPTVDAVADRLAVELAEHGPGPVAVVGISLGGLVAQHLAAAHPELVSHLVLADTLVTYPGPMRQMWAERAALVEAEGVGAVLEATLDTWFGPADEDRTPELEQRCRELVLAASPTAYAATCRALRDADTSGVVDAIAVPTLVVCGEHDGPAFRAGSEHLAARLSGGEVTWLPGAHHASLLEQPQRAAAVIVDFVGRQP